jgi:hypothetical protein
VGQCMSVGDALVEIAKCDVVCSNCHSIRTFTRRQQVTGKRK